MLGVRFSQSIGNIQLMYLILLVNCVTPPRKTCSLSIPSVIENSSYYMRLFRYVFVCILEKNVILSYTLVISYTLLLVMSSKHTYYFHFETISTDQQY